MQGLLRLPPEIVTRILQGCETFPQALSLTTTCKHLNSLWVANCPAVIWAIALRRIIAFDDALMAVRATAIVLAAHQAGERVHHHQQQQRQQQQQRFFSSMRVLSGEYQRPSLAEFKQVLDMQHLVRCLEFMFFNCLITPVWDLFGMEMLKSKYRRQPTAEERAGWQGRFYGAMYRLLLAGAVLADAYLEPFLDAAAVEDGDEEGNGKWKGKEKGKGREVFLERCKTADRGDHQAGNVLDEGDIEYLRRYAVFNFDVLDDSEIGRWRNKEYERIFGPFAEWLVEDGRARGIQEHAGDGGSDVESKRTVADAAQQGAVQELMCLLVAYEHLCCNITNADARAHSGRQRWEYVDQGLIARGTPRTVSVVLFGVFQVEEISMPAHVEDTVSMLLPARQHPSLQPQPQLQSQLTGDGLPSTSAATARGGLFANHRPDISRVLQVLYSPEHTRSEHHKASGDPDPIPTLEVWHFALRHHLNLGFEEDSFQMWTECMWWLYVGTGVVFTDPERAIVEEYVPGRVSWHSRRSAG